jgi:acetyl esterase/lipase
MASRTLRIASALIGGFWWLAAQSQGAADPAQDGLTDQIRALGRVIAPEPTRRLYAPLQPGIDAGTRVERDLAYGPAARHLLDVFAGSAAGRRQPVLVFVHGGDFTRGDRRVGDSPFFDNIGAWAVRQGMVGVNITYRLAPQDPWPAAADDVGLALRWVSEHIGARGGDPARVFLLGHSAGANLAATHLVRNRCGASPCPRLGAVMLLSGIYRITPEARLPLDLVAYFGNEPDLWPERTPFDGLMRVGTPLLLGYAEFDTPRLEDQALRLHDALCKVGRCPVLAKLMGQNHMSLAYSLGSSDRTVGDVLLRFMVDHGAR